MAAGNPRRIAVAAVDTAWANATRSALPWLFTTTAGQSDHAGAVVAARIELLADAAQNRAG